MSREAHVRSLWGAGGEIPPVYPAIHTDRYIATLQHFCKLFAGELGALIGVEDAVMALKRRGCGNLHK